MELIYKASALALLSAVVSLLLKKQNPEAALLLSVLTAVGILIAAMGLLSSHYPQTALRILKKELESNGYPEQTYSR